jgi:hypothetical protein
VIAGCKGPARAALSVTSSGEGAASLTSGGKLGRPVARCAALVMPLLRLCGRSSPLRRSAKVCAGCKSRWGRPFFTRDETDDLLTLSMRPVPFLAKESRSRPFILHVPCARIYGGDGAAWPAGRHTLQRARISGLCMR